MTKMYTAQRHLRKPRTNPVDGSRFGEQEESIYFPKNFGIKIYAGGFSIKMVNQPRIYLEYQQAWKLAELIRNESSLFTKQEAKKLLAKETIDAL